MSLVVRKIFLSSLKTETLLCLSKVSLSSIFNSSLMNILIRIFSYFSYLIDILINISKIFLFSLTLVLRFSFCWWFIFIKLACLPKLLLLISLYNLIDIRILSLRRKTTRIFMLISSPTFFIIVSCLLRWILILYFSSKLKLIISWS